MHIDLKYIKQILMALREKLTKIFGQFSISLPGYNRTRRPKIISCREMEDLKYKLDLIDQYWIPFPTTLELLLFSYKSTWNVCQSEFKC